jgi:hypothetical protein
VVRLEVLSALLLALTPAPMGLWTQSNGEVIEAPCPSALSSGRARLPQSCSAPEAGVLLSRERYTKQVAETAALRTEALELKRQLNEERNKRRLLEADIRGMIAEHELALNTIRATCTTTAKCSDFKPGAIGAIIAASACASAWATYQITR